MSNKKRKKKKGGGSGSGYAKRAAESNRRKQQRKNLGDSSTSLLGITVIVGVAAIVLFVITKVLNG